MTGSDFLLLAAPWLTLGLGLWAGMRLERRRREAELERLLMDSEGPTASDWG